MKSSRSHGFAFAVLTASALVVLYCLRPFVQVPGALHWPVLSTPPPPPTPSLQHLRAPQMPPLEGDRIHLTRPYFLDGDKKLRATTSFFAQHGAHERGVHYTLENKEILENAAHMEEDALLVVTVLDGKTTLGARQRIEKFFELMGSFSHPANRTSVTILTTDRDEFHAVQKTMKAKTKIYAKFSLLFRSDFGGDAHRYRNFALLSTLEKWHEHVVWLDADVHIVARDLVSKMIRADRDIVAPACFLDAPPSTVSCERNSWKNNVQKSTEQFVALDFVGSAMLYVRADVHRQGVLFSGQNVPRTSDRGGFDGFNTAGLCYSAQALGYRCWGMPHDVIYRLDRKIGQDVNVDDEDVYNE